MVSAGAVTAGDLMSSPAIAVRAGATLAEGVVGVECDLTRDAGPHQG